MSTSRLSRFENQRNVRLTLIFTGLSFGLVLLIIFLGLPLLIKFAIFIGDIKSSSQPIESGQNMPIAPPVLVNVPEATNSATIDLNGFSEAGSTVTVFNSEIKEAEIVADNNGNFQINNFQLTSGINSLFARASNQQGQSSNNSPTYRIYFDQKPPELIVNQPIDKLRVSSRQDTVIIQGQSKEASYVLVNSHKVILNADGAFSFTQPLAEGENTLIIEAYDEAGNQANISLTVTRG